MSAVDPYLEQVQGAKVTSLCRGCYWRGSGVLVSADDNHSA